MTDHYATMPSSLIPGEPAAQQSVFDLAAVTNDNKKERIGNIYTKAFDIASKNNWIISKRVDLKEGFQGSRGPGFE